MLFLIFLSSGLFLGWSLGANDAANIFGSAVGSRMIRFRTAAWVSSVFVILGAVIQGHGGAETLNKLGAVSTLAGAFIVAFCAAFVVFAMTKRGLPVSTSQAIVGSIVGWSFYSGVEPNYSTLGKIASTWVLGPILGMVFAAILYLLFRKHLSHVQIHVIKLNIYTRIGLLVAGAFGAYSLGANNIANVMGVFISSAPDLSIDIGVVVFDTNQILFFIGGVTIAIGIATYGQHVMQKVGSGIINLTPEAALIVVLAQALALFTFSSKELSALVVSVGLPPIPLVPISSTQAVIGTLLGIGIVKGLNEIKLNSLYGIALGWILTPVVSCLLTYLLLFFAQNVFKLPVN